MTVRLADQDDRGGWGTNYSGGVGIKIKITKKEVNLGLNWVLQIKGVGRDSDRQRR